MSLLEQVFGLCKNKSPGSGRDKRLVLVIALSLPALPLVAPASVSAQPAAKGQWSAPFAWPNVAIHAHVLPNGKILFWGRREWGANNMPLEGLDPHDCTPRLWDPATNTFTTLPKPGFNLFCSGHTFLADGRLLVVGGHISDSHGEPHATIFDPNQNSWTRIADMNRGRWYPTAVTLPDGSVVVSSGSDQHGQVNDIQQVWNGSAWRSIVNFNGLPLYPRMHVAPDGRVFMSGPLQLTQLLDTSGGGQWTVVRDRLNGQRDYAPSVMYDIGKVLYVGGGNPPSAAAETIDLNGTAPTWHATGSMSFPRRQHNGTILPDGTVLVTGGTQGNGGVSQGFNDLTPGQPIHAPELWDPSSGHWTVLAEEQVDRCYHSTAILLPDATVLSAGGGEYRPNNAVDQPNDPKDSHRDAQIFSPPYLFRGARPTITNAPATVSYGQSFAIGTPAPGDVGQVNWTRLSSVTHAFNSNQRINFLKFTVAANGLRVTAPANANQCAPGHYMLFILNKQNVPSIARIIRIH
jgi:hypothetical protein